MTSDTNETKIMDLNLTETDLAMTAAIRVIGDVARERDELRADLRYAIDKIESLEEQLRTARNDLMAGRNG